MKKLTIIPYTAAQDALIVLPIISINKVAHASEVLTIIFGIVKSKNSFIPA
jgi:hypothetical protein